MQKKKGIILMNLGSPDSTKVSDVRRYLNQFLMDERVIDIPLLSRTILVKGIIVPFRAPKSAAAYKTIWTEQGSPLIETTRQLQYALQEKTNTPVAIAMRYGNPAGKEAFEQLLKSEPLLEEVVAIPLYPHYAMSSYETAVENMKAIHAQNKYSFTLKFVPPFYNHPSYINALASSMQPYVSKAYDHILFSYHGVPGRHIRKSDTTGSHCLKINDCCQVPSAAHGTCYRHQCFSTTKLVTQRLGIPENKFSISFQSRLGKGWLEPFTDIRLKEMPAEGIKKLLVVCPAFVSDCLETLEEIAERGKEIFMDAGGEAYVMIPCMNTQEPWVDAVFQLLNETSSISPRFQTAAV